jgi:hypothetical protein
MKPILSIKLLATALGRGTTWERRVLWTAAFLAGFLAIGTMAAQAQTPATDEDPLKATSSRAAQEEALQSLPSEKLDADARAKIESVLANVSLFRRLPVRVMQCDPDLYVLLVQHPDIVVNIWRMLGVTHMSVQQTTPNIFRVTDGTGTIGTLEYLYRSPETQVVYSDGTYEGPLFGKTIHCKTLAILKSGYVLEGDGRYYITTRLDAFMNVQNLGAEILTKTFQPLVCRAADINFTQTASFVSSLSHTAEINPTGLQRLSSKMVRVPTEVRQQFAETSERVAQRAAALPERTVQGPPLPYRKSDLPASSEPRVAQRPTISE